MTASFMDQLTNFVPGFGSYRTEQKRRDDDAAVRRFLADRLQECKRDLQLFMVPLVDQANFAAVNQGEKLRSHIETVQSKIRASVEGYSSWFESTKIDEAKLKQVLDLDNDLVGVIDRLQHEIASLASGAPNFSEAESVITSLKDRFARRKELLSR
jgi:predicted aminopeptidase